MKEVVIYGRPAHRLANVEPGRIEWSRSGVKLRFILSQTYHSR